MDAIQAAGMDKLTETDEDDDLIEEYGADTE